MLQNIKQSMLVMASHKYRIIILWVCWLQFSGPAAELHHSGWNNFIKSNPATARFETRTDILKSITKPFKLELRTGSHSRLLAGNPALRHGHFVVGQGFLSAPLPQPHLPWWHGACWPRAEPVHPVPSKMSLDGHFESSASPRESPSS